MRAEEERFGETLARGVHALHGRLRSFLDPGAQFAADDRPGPSEIAAPGHTNLDAGLSWFPIEPLELRAAVRNLLDEAYYASPDRRFVLAPGINAAVTAAVRFSCAR